jgi:hypothetical protein
MRPLLIEYARPWKLLTLLAGVSLMIAGALANLAPDWDVPISLIMPLLTYLTAPWSMRVVLLRTWRKFPLMLFYTWGLQWTVSIGFTGASRPLMFWS